MVINLHLHYKVNIGEVICILYRSSVHTEDQILYFQTFDGENWTGILDLGNHPSIRYKYAVERQGSYREEAGEWRFFEKPESPLSRIFFRDAWRNPSDQKNLFEKAAFKDVLFRKNHLNKTSPLYINPDVNEVTFELRSAILPSNYVFGIVGSLPELGEWVTPLPLSDSNSNGWIFSLEIDSIYVGIEYKFVLLDPITKEIVGWEGGENRKLYFTFPTVSGNYMKVGHEGFRYEDFKWKGAGVAIPVFSLRSHQSFGIGEFLDLKVMTDWVKATRMKLIQVLPVNDTLANMTWRDSYPYAAISVFALHPLYINIPAIAEFKNNGIAKEYENDLKKLNELGDIDFELVLQRKFHYFKILFSDVKGNLEKDVLFQKFLSENSDWIKAYAVFCALRDANGTPNFNNWPKYSRYFDSDVQSFFQPKHRHYEDVMFYVWLQYHADKQLKEARNYARNLGVVLKGDLPIGIYRYSADAWTAPELYNMNEQAGAPPDDYAALGQNWGFPTYNWEVMAKDGFLWWRKRMQKLAEYFDALRIDHILGFFRIWQIPMDQVQGTMGLFNPRIPLRMEEIAKAGFGHQIPRLTNPYIRTHMIFERFRDQAKWVIEHFLHETEHGVFLFNSDYKTQSDIEAYFLAHPELDLEWVKEELFTLMAEVLLIPEPESHGMAFNPRITLGTTQSFKELGDYEKSMMLYLYNSYFFQRHDEFWKIQALKRLPALLEATDMLICGEDLGMIPATVPQVMDELKILSLEIQRMPKGNQRFGNVRYYPYLSVCSPSCHDMSTIRGWWEEDYENARHFFNNYLGIQGEAPRHCEEYIVRTIVKDHMESPSMWAIFPLQDLVGMDATIRKAEAASEQINVPANVKHYWRFRFHIPIESLLHEHPLNYLISEMIMKAGR